MNTVRFMSLIVALAGCSAPTSWESDEESKQSGASCQRGLSFVDGAAFNITDGAGNALDAMPSDLQVIVDVGEADYYNHDSFDLGEPEALHRDNFMRQVRVIRKTNAGWLWSEDQFELLHTELIQGAPPEIEITVPNVVSFTIPVKSFCIDGLQGAETNPGWGYDANASWWEPSARTEGCEGDVVGFVDNQDILGFHAELLRGTTWERDNGPKHGGAKHLVYLCENGVILDLVDTLPRHPGLNIHRSVHSSTVQRMGDVLSARPEQRTTGVGSAHIRGALNPGSQVEEYCDVCLVPQGADPSQCKQVRISSPGGWSYDSTSRFELQGEAVAVRASFRDGRIFELPLPRTGQARLIGFTENEGDTLRLTISQD